MRAPTRQHTSPNPEQIAAIAYSLWEQAGRPVGRDVEFWLEAERLIASQLRAVEKATGPARSSVAAATPSNTASADVIAPNTGPATRLKPTPPKRTSSGSSARPR